MGALIAAAVVATGIGGCGLTQSPSARIEGGRVVDRSAEAVRFDVAARLTNPNREESLELRTVRYTVRFEGGGSYRGLRAAQATLAPGSESVLQLPVVIAADRIPPGVSELEWSIAGELLYIAPGALAETLLDTGVRRPTIRFDGGGRVALDGAIAPREATPLPPAGPPIG